MEKPAVMRKHAATPSIATSSLSHAVPAKPVAASASQELDYLDIPAFLRRKEELVD